MFVSLTHLADHMSVHQKKKNFICESCGKGFATQRSLDLHSITHTGVKSYQCTFCNKLFARKGEVDDHIRTHTGERPFQCDICGVTFSQRSNLQSHKRTTHLQERRYQCTECHKAFKRKRLLVYHIMSVHTGERPYKCSECSASFVYPEHYKKHLRIHTGEKPFKCDVCGKSFNSRDNRNSHKFIHSDKKPYECAICGAGFMRKPMLQSHLPSHGHSDNYDAWIKVNPPSILDQPEDDERPEERSVHIIEADDLDALPRYIIHAQPEDAQENNESHFLAELNGQVVEVRSEDLERRWGDLTPEQMSQVAAQVAAQVVQGQSNGHQVQQVITSDIITRHIHLEPNGPREITVQTLPQVQPAPTAAQTAPGLLASRPLAFEVVGPAAPPTGGVVQRKGEELRTVTYTDQRLQTNWQTQPNTQYMGN